MFCEGNLHGHFLVSTQQLPTMHNAVNGSVKRAKQRRTKAERKDRKGRKREERSKASLKGAELKQAKASNEPANQPASHPDGRLLTVKPRRSRESKFTLLKVSACCSRRSKAMTLKFDAVHCQRLPFPRINV